MDDAISREKHNTLEDLKSMIDETTIYSPFRREYSAQNTHSNVSRQTTYIKEEFKYLNYIKIILKNGKNVIYKKCVVEQS